MLSGTRWAQVRPSLTSICNVVAEKMRYPHQRTDDGHVIQNDDLNCKEIYKTDEENFTTFPTVYNLFGLHKWTQHVFDCVTEL